jgi:hypothetical protein
MDSLASAVVDVVGLRAAGKEWGRPPQLYALARKKVIRTVDPGTAAILSGRQDDALIPIEQDPLPPGDPEEALAGIHWAKQVEGCVLVTELFVLPPGAEKKAPDKPSAAEQWAAGYPGGKQARIAVGVLRDGSYTCCLQVRGDEQAIVAPDLADDLVTALLVTFVPANTADPEASPAPDR